MTAKLIPANVVVCSFLMAIAMLVAYVTKKHHFIYLPESSSAMLLGMVFGALSLVLKMGLEFSFSPEIFFYGLLPIIIFNAGYGLKKKDFFRNFSSIILFAVVGTVLSALVYGLCTYFFYEMGIISHMSSKSPLLESMMFGALISAIDPVATLSIFQDVQAPSLLYNLVFGESLVNDASSIVLFRTFESFLQSEFSFSTIGVAIMWFCAISVGSIVLGVVVSLCCALALKYIDIRSEYSKFELAFILLSAYMSYSVAEIMGLSGIMALFFCGICNAHYGYYSTSHASKISSKYAFEALSFLSELFVFAYLGMQVVVLHHVVDIGLLATAIPLCLLSRAVNIFPLSWLANRSRTKKITTNMKIMMWLSGLRGAIAYALAVNMPTGNHAIETTTLFVVVSTTLVLGGGTGPMLSYLGLTPRKSGVAPAGQGGLDVPLVGGQSLYEVLDRYEGWGPPSGFHRWFKYIDQTYMKPVFGGQTDRVLDYGGFPEEDELLSEEKAEKLRPYIGVGFALQVPTDWEEKDDGPLVAEVLVRLQSPASPDGELPAEVMVTLHPSQKADVEDYGEPMDFLTDQWEELKFGEQVWFSTGCLARGGSSWSEDAPVEKGGIHPYGASFTSPKIDEVRENGEQRRQSGRSSVDGTTGAPVQRALSSGSMRAHDPAGLNFRPSRSFRSGPGPSKGDGGVPSRFGKSLSSGHLLSPKDEQEYVAQKEFPAQGHVGPSSSAKGRLLVVPAFVMWADGIQDPGGRVYYQYEVVIHPEEIDSPTASEKAEVCHILLSVSGHTGAIFVCRILATERWWYDGGFRTAKRILDSFRVRDEELA